LIRNLQYLLFGPKISRCFEKQKTSFTNLWRENGPLSLFESSINKVFDNNKDDQYGKHKKCEKIQLYVKKAIYSCEKENGSRNSWNKEKMKFDF